MNGTGRDWDVYTAAIHAMPGEGNGLRRVPMMDGSDHSRHALARRGSEMGEQGPQGLLEFCPIQLDTVQLNWTWFSSR